MGFSIAAAAVFSMVALLTYNAIVSYRWHRENRGEEYIRESSHWHRTFFYSNSEDPRLIVPKRTGGGYTFNFAKPLSWFFIGSGLILLIALIMVA